MNYEKGLQILSQKIEHTEYEEQFKELETKLLKNLRSERRFGPDESTRRERSILVDELNILSVNMHLSFNELCI